MSTFVRRDRDSESGLIYLRARYYDPATGQFLTVDPAVASTRAPYGYVAGNPLNTTDPSGLCGLWGSDTCWGDAAGAIGSVWNHTAGSFDWGTTTAGVFNVVYGGYKLVSGAEAAAASIGLLFTPPPFDLLAIPSAITSIYQLGTGAAREVKGIRQIVSGATTPATQCTIGDNALRFGLGVIPAGGAGRDIWDFIGGLP